MLKLHLNRSLTFHSSIREHAPPVAPDCPFFLSQSLELMNLPGVAGVIPVSQIDCSPRGGFVIKPKLLS